ncbi:MAG: hypothetical protein IJN64_01140 [Lachnospiraceae bacterium]|nr:hypothetical protein [Lachnospiraceae bacterium]
MSFSPFARFRNFTVENLKALLEVYPDQAEQFTWSEAGEIMNKNLYPPFEMGAEAKP